MSGFLSTLSHNKARKPFSKSFCIFSAQVITSALFYNAVRWPECLERQANILLERENASGEHLHELLALTSVPVRFEVIPELSTTLVLALNHANRSTRLAAVKHLSNKLTHGQLVCLLTRV